MDKIRKYVGNNKIWVSIDESIDVDGWYVGNVIIGALEINKPDNNFYFTPKF